MMKVGDVVPPHVPSSEWATQAPVCFYLGTHKPAWLASETFRHVPLFVSRRVLAPRRQLPRAVGRWALDSGGFTELAIHGRWSITPVEYVREVRRISVGVGGLEWAAPQDWMVEPAMLQKTGRSIADHQRLTVSNYLDLRQLAPDLPIVPVLQGWTLGDYWRCADQYERRGVALAKLPLVGVGTLCRRQGTNDAVRILTTLAAEGLRLHGFGFKTQGLRRCAGILKSADSMAWSLHARRRPPIEGHDLKGAGRRAGHKNCANCPDYALQWLSTMLEGVST
jgi:hypothetical protein